MYMALYNIVLSTWNGQINIWYLRLVLQFGEKTPVTSIKTANCIIFFIHVQFFLQSQRTFRKKEADRVFDRIADSFVALFTSIHPEIKDKFLSVSVSKLILLNFIVWALNHDDNFTYLFHLTLTNFWNCPLSANYSCFAANSFNQIIRHSQLSLLG